MLVIWRYIDWTVSLNQIDLHVRIQSNISPPLELKNSQSGGWLLSDRINVWTVTLIRNKFTTLIWGLYNSFSEATILFLIQYYIFLIQYYEPYCEVLNFLTTIKLIDSYNKNDLNLQMIIYLNENNTLHEITDLRKLISLQ